MKIEKEKQRLSQEKMLEIILKEPRPTEMLTVYFSDHESETYDYGIYCALVPLGQKDEVLSNHSWDLIIGAGVPGSCISYKDGEEKPEYFRFGSDDGIEPLIISRDFYGFKDEYKEISEEFRLFHNLYHDDINDRYIKIGDDGSEVAVIEVAEECIKIRVKELKQFLAIKEMYLSIQFDCREYSKFSAEELSLDENGLEGEDEHVIWILGYGDSCGFSGYQVISRLLGKRLIIPFPKSKSGIYGFAEKEPKKYVDFIIDIDDAGGEVIFSSNPELLADFFGANPDSPNYLTPVHFKKEVLDKYYNRPSRYSVEDSCLRCASLWGLQIDNHHDDKICVWLGDLGRDLPYEEQLYWRSYNIAPSGGISKTYYSRQIMAQPMNSDRPEHIFKSKYNQLQRISKEYLGWDLLLPLSNEDAHHFECLRVPSTNEQNDFDSLVLSLTKIVIDSLNEKKLNKYIDKFTQGEIKGSISKLEAVLRKEGAENYEEYIGFLRKLQNLRSSSSAHRKGSNYKKIVAEFKIWNKDLITVFEGILYKSIDFLEYLTDLILSEKLSKS